MKDATDTRPASRVLDIGCGRDKLPNAISMDVNPRSDADVIHDLDSFPWPFPDNAFDYIRAQDVLEHVADFEKCMAEVFRVGAPNSIVEVRMPFMGGINFATDPTHRRAGTSRTFDYFDPTKPLGAYRYSEARFEVLSTRYEKGNARSFLGRMFELADKVVLPWIQSHKFEYELYFAGFYPMHNVCYQLRVIKE